MTKILKEDKELFKIFQIESKEVGTDNQFCVTCHYMDGDADNYWEEEHYFDNEQKAFTYYKFYKMLAASQTNGEDYDVEMIVKAVKENPEFIKIIDQNEPEEHESLENKYEEYFSYMIKAYDEGYIYPNGDKPLEHIENTLNDWDFFPYEKSNDNCMYACFQSVTCHYSTNNIIYNLQEKKAKK